jgi:hypothetical protein
VIVLTITYFKYIKRDDQQDLYAVYYQSQQMKEFFERHPGVLFIDTFYCLNDAKYPALAIVAQDDVGHLYPVGLITSL